MKGSEPNNNFITCYPTIDSISSIALLDKHFDITLDMVFKH